MSHPTPSRLSRRQRSITDLKSEIFCLCSERVCVCDGGGGMGYVRKIHA